ncbi:MAG: hypothetical protein AB7F66_11030 [Bacteriovoracia bacterium]
MDDTTLKSKKVRPVDRVCLGEKALKSVDQKIEQIMANNRGVTINRKDMVNWLLENRAPLSSDEEKTIASIYYNEIRFLQNALKEMKAARSRGESMSLDAIISAKPTARKERKPRIKKQKNLDTKETLSEANQNSEATFP